MNKLIKIFSAAALLLPFTACSNDDWDYDHSKENEFFYGPEVWGYDASKLGNNNVVTYDVEEGKTVDIPMQFWSNFTRSFNVETYYWTAPKHEGEKYYSQPWKNKDQVTYDGTELVRRVDYEVVDENGTPLQPEADGAFSMTWPNAKKGVQNIRIKALGGKKGAINVLTFNHADEQQPTNQNVESTFQTKASQYSVRIFTQNYRVTVVIK